MNDNLLKIINRITSQYGEDILGDAKRLKSLFHDLAKDEPKPLRKTFGSGVEKGFYRIIKNTKTPKERREVIDRSARRLRDEEGLDLGVCTEALELFAAAVFGKGAVAPASATASAQPDNKTPQKARKPGGETAESPANMIRIPGGTFMMGRPANDPVNANDGVRHQVTVSGFFMGKYAVTQKEYCEVMRSDIWFMRDVFLAVINATDWPLLGEGDNYPMYYVGWYNAVYYCNRLSEHEGLTPVYTINETDLRWNRSANGYRLPTEAEWEYACRAGTTTPFNTGNNITTSQANYFPNNAKGTNREKTVEVGSFAPNAWGLYDMPGNVWEWCWDWFGDYPNGAQSDPIGPPTGSERVVRGGSWNSEALWARSSSRSSFYPYQGYDSVGFRLVRSP